MKNFYTNLKTSDRITFLFSLFNFISLIILLIGINIIYFFIWYSDQKQESLYDMNKNYSELIGEDKNNLEAFKDYILQKDTLIIPPNGEQLICSNGVENKVHRNVDQIKDKLFYNSGEKIFFIYSQNYPEIGEVKVFFDTTPYVKSQIIIIKISLFIIFFSLIFYFFIGKKITKYSLKDLTRIKNKAEEIDIEKDFQKIQITGNKFDEINILASTINSTFSHIKKQTSNLKQFTDDVSHEFKTPLMVINSKIDLFNKKIEKGKLNKSELSVLFDSIKKSTKILNSFLETFLFLSRIECDIENLQKREFSLKKYLKYSADNYLELNNISKHCLKINYKLSGSKKIKIEENTFKVLFENILSNAIKFSNSSQKGCIKIEIGCDQNSFWIIDNGIGISKEDLKIIFYKFYRKNKKIDGFGIGLFLVKRLVNLYNWKLDIQSEIGKGTKFIVKF